MTPVFIRVRKWTRASTNHVFTMPPPRLVPIPAAITPSQYNVMQSIR